MAQAKPCMLKVNAVAGAIRNPSSVSTLTSTNSYVPTYPGEAGIIVLTAPAATTKVIARTGSEIWKACITTQNHKTSIAQTINVNNKKPSASLELRKEVSPRRKFS